MNIEDIRKLSPELQREYIEVEKRFTSDVWGWIKEWAEEQMALAQHRAAYAESWEMNRLNIGFTQGLQMLLGEEATAFQRFELALEDVEEVPDYAGDLQL